MTPLEADVMRACKAVLETRRDVFAWRCHSGRVRVKGGWMHLAPEGTADFVGILRDGRFIGIEIKRDDRKASTSAARRDAQRLWAERVRICGGVAIQVSSAAELTAALDNL